jgi:hypothetical protein
MTERKSLSVNSVEFDNIKSNLKSFLQNQSTFKDYDFDGSGLSVMLDLLAYNTYYQAFYNNMTANEMFLDSAAKRSSVVSHAKNLGYTPNSKTASTTLVDVTYPGTPTNTTLLPGEQFVTSINGKSYTFVNTDTASIGTSGGYGFISNLTIKEGSLENTTYIVPDYTNNIRYELKDNNIDISTVKVRVQASQTDTTGINDIWSKAGDLTEITGTTKAFWIQENTMGNYEIIFGDNILGSKPEAGNVITITYLITSGSVANGAGNGETTDSRAFTYLNSSYDVAVKSVSLGGAEKESINSIRFKAPRAFATQNRAVTETDYASQIETNFTGFDAVYVYGGEEADPPVYGSVYVVVKPTNGNIISDDMKNQIELFLRKKTVLSITPILRDPDYTYIKFGVNVFYDSTKTTLSTDAVSSVVRSSVEQNLNTNLGKFNDSFSISKLLSSIDSSSSSINSSSVDVTMEKRFLPSSIRPISYEIKFGNPIEHPHSGHMSVLSSNTFKYLDPSDLKTKNVFMEDDGFGTINFYTRINEVTKELILGSAGSIDYDNGVVRINQVQIQSPNDTPQIKIYAKSREPRYVSNNEKIVFCDYQIDPSVLTITTNGITQNTTITTTINTSSAFTSTLTNTSNTPNGSGY